MFINKAINVSQYDVIIIINIIVVTVIIIKVQSESMANQGNFFHIL